MEPTMTFKWIRKLSFVREGGAYKVWKDASGQPAHEGVPVLQQLWAKGNRTEYRDVGIEQETLDEAQKRVDRLNAKLKKGAQA